jgi:heat shock protein HslJ
MFSDFARRAGTAFALALLLGASPSAAAGGNTPSASDQTPAAALPDGVLDTVWEWTWFGSGAEQFDVDNPEQYTLQFFADGTLALQADCNRGRGEYAIDAEGQITLSRLGTTMMLCEEDSRADQFLQSLERVRLFFEKDGDFFLEAPIDSGTLRFRPATAEE